jgi:hypothetical protein
MVTVLQILGGLWICAFLYQFKNPEKSDEMFASLGLLLIISAMFYGIIGWLH